MPRSAAPAAVPMNQAPSSPSATSGKVMRASIPRMRRDLASLLMLELRADARKRLAHLPPAHPDLEVPHAASRRAAPGAIAVVTISGCSVACDT